MHILGPSFALFALTAFSLFRLGFMRFSAAKNQRIDPRFFRTYRGYDEPEYLAAASRNFVNLFEMPVLFYVSSILIYITDQANVVLVGLSWVYVGLRYIHSYIHLTSNIVIRRFRIYVLSCLVLFTIWVIFGLQLLRM